MTNENDETPAEVRQKMEVVIRRPTEQLDPFLAGYNFYLAGSKSVSAGPKASPFSLNLKYKNQALGLMVSLTYFPIFIFHSEKMNDDLFSLTIFKDLLKASPANNPGTGAKVEEVVDYDNFIQFEGFLKKTVPSFNEDILRIYHYKGTFEQQIDAVFSAYKQLLHDYADDLLRGRKWKKDFELSR